jgi:hypothetical protein
LSEYSLPTCENDRMVAITINLERQMLEATILQHLMVDTQFLFNQKADQSIKDRLSNKPTSASPRCLSGYFPTKRDMQLARAESLAG